MGGTFIAADDTWSLMALTCAWVAFSIYAEQKWEWGAKLSGAMIALIGAIFLSNAGVIPASSVWSDDIVWSYAVPLAIPLLLLQCDLLKIWQRSARLLLLFVVGAVGTAVSAVLAHALLSGHIDDLSGIAAMMTGSYIGGGVNFVALADAYKVPPSSVASSIVADNLLMACYFFVLIAIPSMKFFRAHYQHPYQDRVEAVTGGGESANVSASYWKARPISILDIALCLAIASVIVAVSSHASRILDAAIPKDGWALTMLNGMLGNKYFIITTISICVSTFAARQISRLGGAQEIGTALIYLFLFAIGVPASISEIVRSAPLLFAFCGIMVAVNMLFCFVFGKVMGYSLEEIILASNANIGGPTTAAAMAISKGWTDLVGPIMLVGTLGYILGTYLGLFVGQMLGA